MWHHEHIFKSTETGGVMMEDIVSYVVPSGFLGRIMNRLVIEKKYMRFLTTEEMF
jgi:ligand-binding SRPBCC domain-containing protein